MNTIIRLFFLIIGLSYASPEASFERQENSQFSSNSAQQGSQLPQYSPPFVNSHQSQHNVPTLPNSYQEAHRNQQTLSNQQNYQNQQNAPTLPNSYQEAHRNQQTLSNQRNYQNQQNVQTLSNTYQQNVQTFENSYQTPYEGYQNVQQSNTYQPYGPQRDVQHLVNLLRHPQRIQNPQPYARSEKNKNYNREVYTYMINFADGFKRVEKGYVTKDKDGKNVLTVDGWFSHVGTEGTEYRVDYTSDIGQKPKGPKTGISAGAIGSLGGGLRGSAGKP